ncbi:unnamed protein product [marine sediment metagenome]|uniref:Uncharacterized protein n=1 Tax=marine sediment metagenome TaxID=412755 RepID=X1C490_9ZZZZ
MKNVEFLGVELDFYCKIDYTQYDMGSVQLKLDGRSYIVDVVRGEITYPNGGSLWSSEVEVDKETFDETYTKYDLTPADLMDSNLVATIFLGGDYEVEPESMTLYVKFLNEDGSGCTKAIDLIHENDAPFEVPMYQKVVDAKLLLQSQGYFTENLWCVDDVKGKFKCDNDDAQEVLRLAMSNEATYQ